MKYSRSDRVNLANRWSIHGPARGLDVVTTCSPRNVDLVRSLDANHVYDYSSPDIADCICKAVPGIKCLRHHRIRGGLLSHGSQAAVPDYSLCTVSPGCTITEGVANMAKVVDAMIYTVFLKHI